MSSSQTGFTGNIVLKSWEGFGDTIQNFKQLWRGVYKTYHVHGSALLNSVGLDSWAKEVGLSRIWWRLFIGSQR